MTTLMEMLNFMHEIVSKNRPHKHTKIKEINTVLTSKARCVNCTSEVYGPVVTSQAEPPILNTVTRLYVPGTNSIACMCAHTHTHAPPHTDTHLCTAETHHYGNTGASSDSGKVQNVHVIGTEG